MLVSNRMTREPETIEPQDLVSRAAHKMQAGGFRRLPVVSDGKLVGIITDRDLRQHRGHFEQTKTNGVMTENPITATASMTVEEAAQLMLKHQIGGLPVISEGRLVGMITVSDVLNAFLDVMGASKGGSTRIDFVLEGEEHGLLEASRLVARDGGEILGVGTYREKLDESPICYLRIIDGNADTIVKALRAGGFNVLGVHRIGAAH
jgi:acetoin utilization protein AcuB